MPQPWLIDVKRRTLDDVEFQRPSGAHAFNWFFDCLFNSIKKRIEKEGDNG